MSRRRRLKRALIDRFMSRIGAPESERPGVDDPNRRHVRRFMKMVDQRKTQLLQRVLMEDER